MFRPNGFTVFSESFRSLSGRRSIFASEYFRSIAFFNSPSAASKNQLPLEGVS